MTRVLIVEDEPAIAELVAINLRHEGFEVSIAADAATAVERVDERLPDLAILDWMLPGRSGLQLARDWRAQQRTKTLPIILLTARADEADKLAGLDGGADDYLTKPFSTKELLARVRALLRRRAPQALDEAVEVAGLVLDPATRRVTRIVDGAAREAKVGPTEFRLLHFLMTHPERVHSRAQLLDRVWGDHVFIEERTVDVHIKRLREALEPVQRAALVETVRGAGYRFGRVASAAMNEALGRVLALLAGLVAGAVVGWIVGGVVGAGAWGSVVGAALGVSLMALRDALRAERLLQWLRVAHTQSQTPTGGAPRDAGFWGEMAYRIEKALRLRENETVAERERLRQFLDAIEASPNGVLLLDADGRIEWCNARAADHFGLDPQRDQRQLVTNLLRAPDFVEYLQAGVYDGPIEFSGPRGRTTVSVLVRSYGAGQRLLLSQDVTDRERMESMRRDFVANVSHEIRTPLTVLAGFVDTLATVPLSTTERPRVLELMRQQTTRIQTLVDDLLTLAQLEGSPRPSSDQWVKCDALVKRVAADAEMLSAGRHELSVDVQPGIELAGTETELASAMGNLLGNAVRYTPDSGHIEVRLALRDGGAVFEVRDNGIGIAREHIPRLTERFYRVDGSRSRETGGTGLGLAIVKHVVTRHGGELEVESEPGKGSTFRLVLPAARVRSRKPTASAETVAVTVSGAAPASAHRDR